MELEKSMYCLFCSISNENNTFVKWNDKSEQIFKNCFIYLHTAITKERSLEINFRIGDFLPLCESCSNSASELTKLNEKLVKLQKQISDLNVSFSLSVFYRRNQADKKCRKLQYRRKQNLFDKNKQIVELDVSGLPPYLFLESPSKKFVAHKNSEYSNRREEEEDANLFAAQLIHNSSKNNEEEIVKQEECGEDLYCNDQSMSYPEEDVQESTGIFININQGNSYDNANDPLQTAEDIIDPLMDNCENVIDPLPGASSHILLSDTTSGSSQQLTRLKFILDRAHGDRQHVEGHHESSQIKYENKEREESHSSIDMPTVFKCRFCNKGISTRDRLKKHEKYHTREKHFECKMCKKRFSTSAQLKVHEVVHAGKKPYQCSYCEKTFNFQGNLTKHHRIHTGEKPYSCMYCGKTFADGSTKNRHEFTHLRRK